MNIISGKNENIGAMEQERNYFGDFFSIFLGRDRDIKPQVRKAIINNSEFDHYIFFVEGIFQ
jgi:hypothetical protein